MAYRVESSSTKVTVLKKSSTGPVHSLCVVGKEIWCGSTGYITIWDTTKRQPKKEIHAHKAGISSLILIDREKLNHSSSHDNLLQYPQKSDWTPPKTSSQGIVISHPLHDESQYQQIYSQSLPNHLTKSNLTTVSNNLSDLDINSSSPMKRNPSYNSLTVPLPDRTVWSASLDGTIKIWDTREHNDYRSVKTLHQWHNSSLINGEGDGQPFTCLQRVGERVWGGTLRAFFLWDLSGIPVTKLEVDSDSPPLCVMASGRYLWCGLDKYIHVYSCSVSLQFSSAKSAKPIKVFSDHNDTVLCLVHVADAQHVWSGDASGDIILWNCELFEPITILKGAHSGAVCSMSALKVRRDKDDFEIWTTGKDQVIRVWDEQNAICIKSLKKHRDIIYSLVHTEKNGTVDQIWTGSHHICIWEDEKISANNIRLLSYENGDKYVGEIIADDDDTILRHGRGEYHSVNGDIFVGYWNNNMRQGYGIVTYKNKDKYYGDWLNDMRWGHGVYIYNDGTCFEGMWKSGIRKGPGVLLLPNGDKLEGEWKDDELTKAKYTKGTIVNNPNLARCMEDLFRLRSEMNYNTNGNSNTMSWNPSASRDFFDSPKVLQLNKWNYFTLWHVKEVERQLRGLFPEMSLSTKDLSIILTDGRTQLGNMIEDFSYLFNASYHHSYGDVPTLLQNAVDDVHSFINNMMAVITNLVPSIKVKDSFKLVSNILFSKIHNSLISLYKEVNQSRDVLFNVKIHSLSGITLRKIGVKPKFWLNETVAPSPSIKHPTNIRSSFGLYDSNDNYHFNLNDDEDVASFNKTIDANSPYASAISKLRQLPDIKTVSKKLHLLKEVSQSILQCIDAFYRPFSNSDECHDDSQQSHTEAVEEDSIDNEILAVGAEDKFPIFLYCIIKAQLPDLYSELDWMKEFANTDIFTEESQYRLVELQQAILYIESLDWTVFDEEGVLISVSFLEKSLIDALQSARSVFLRKKKEPPRLLWLAEILLICGTRGRSSPGEKMQSFYLGKEYNTYLRDDDYLQLGKLALQPVAITLVRVEGRTQLVFQHEYPQHLYSRFSQLVEHHIQYS